MEETKPLKILKASAGSGKTFALTVHFLSLLLQRPESYREILALTFTNKATAEMKARILRTLRLLAQQDVSLPENTELASYHQELLITRPYWSRGDIQQRADQAYRKIIHDYSRFSVLTIDRFSQQVIRGFTYELGLDSGFRIELNTDKVRKDLMERLYEQLNEQEELFEWVIGQMVSKIDSDKSWNINRELHNLSSIIFNDDFKALEEVAGRPGNENLFDRIALLTKQRLEGFEKEFRSRAALIADFMVMYDVGASDLRGVSKNFLLKFEVLREKCTDYPLACANLEKFIDNRDAYQSDAKRSSAVDALYDQINPLITELHDYLSTHIPEYMLAQAVDKNIHYLRLLKDMAGLLADWRVEHGAQLISDAQLLLAKIGRTEHGDPTFIWEKMGNRYRNFLLDEFQDTSHAQWDNLLPLVVNAMSTSSHNHTAHLIVGDVKQSIYRWRNGDFRILLDGVEKNITEAFHLQDSSALISNEHLETNYRSEENIIHFNNYVYQKLPAKLQELMNNLALAELGDSYENVWIDSGLSDVIVRAYENSEQQIPAHKQGSGKGTIQVEYLGVPQGEKGKLTLSVFREMACERVFDQIAEWLDTGRYAPGEIGVLVRNNKEASLLVEYVRWRQVHGERQFRVISGDALQIGGHQAIKCIISALRFMAYQGRDFNSYLADTVFYYHAQQGLIVPEEAWMACSAGDVMALRKYLPENLIWQWQELQMMPLATLVERLIDCFDFDEDDSAVPHLLELRDMVAHYITTGLPSLQRFLEFWDEEGSTKSLSGGAQSNAVEIMTIHKSKGLEYEVVLLPFCTWALKGKPDNQVWFDVRQTYAADMERIPLHFDKNVRASTLIGAYLEEELYNFMDALNTLYVATTRAKKHLFILSNNPTTATISTIGDLMLPILKGHPATLDVAEAKLPLQLVIEGSDWNEFAIQDTEKSVGLVNGEFVVLHGYPSTNALQRALLPRNKERAIVSQQQKVSALFSNALHELMASAHTEKEVRNELAHLMMEGQLTSKEGEQAFKWVVQAWKHQDLQPYFSGNYTQSNEQGIIDASGKMVRPDKVFFNAEETLVVDFKLSAELGHVDHLAQIRTYMAYLEEMGLPGVRGYLYYFIQNETVAI